jgi:methylthioribulose 1-phosphate dehydratase / enolase-phosphatase E1
VYVWGNTWIQAKTQAECYDYLFDAAVRMRQLGIDASRPPAPLLAANGAAAAAAANGGGAAAAANGGGAKRGGGGAEAGGAKRARPAAGAAAGQRRPPAAVVLDIEGTVAPISFVADVMFPYARQHARGFLEAGWGGAEVEADVEAIRKQARPAGARSRAVYGSGLRFEVLAAVGKPRDACVLL